jgi:hypothetical protein
MERDGLITRTVHPVVPPKVEYKLTGKKDRSYNGGTSGIGLELARQLLQRGNTVIVTGRDQEKLDAAKLSGRCPASIGSRAMSAIRGR